MKNLFHAGKLLLLDMASTVFFLVLYLLTNNIWLAVALSIALGFAQIGWEIVSKRPIDTMQWVSLIVVVASGTGTLVTNDPRFVMIKPSLIYVAVGLAMLKPGWMNRYQPEIALHLVPDVILVFGYIWAGLMFLTAIVNVIVAMHESVAAWASWMSAFGIASKLALFALQYAVSRAVGVRRARQRATA
jgi:intracellular septation protein A